ncbi:MULTISPECIES: hypothetical protein [unclassified Brevibacterium]|uniref:hypothetical protein n=1 Tax=unclassified Brevibacterium TaxID=2614124 RepID=UPI0020175791|nr:MULTISPECIES: hypothetical protein [unclassified Brevibacterium]MCM1011351.1 hypothetical protein [Brevibacterium sp. XM4083]
MDTRAGREMRVTRDNSTAAGGQASGAGCEHGWLTESRHRISTGLIVYLRCASCGARRVDHLGAGALVPSGLSRVVAPR